MRFEDQLEKEIELRTEEASTEEWSTAQSRAGVPLFNYRLDHTKQVVRIVKILAEGQNVDLQSLTFAAWLHDISKPGIQDKEEHGKRSAEIATEILLEMGLEGSKIESIADIISKHVGLTRSTRQEPLEAQLLWEADKLSKLGATGLVYFLINGIRIKPGRTLCEISEDTENYLPLAEEIAGSMFTPRAKRMAENRMESLRRYAETLKSELFKLERWI